MFKLYYFIEHETPAVVFSNSELAPCLMYIRAHNYIMQRCLIVAPNNRRITFNINNDLVFEGLN